MKYLMFTFLLALSTRGLAQNYLITDERSTFHGSVLLSTSNFENIVAILPGYTVKGRLTFGFDFGKAKDKLNKLNSTIIRPNINYLIIKQDNGGLPFSLSAEAGYQYNILQTTTFNSRTIQFGANLYHELDIDQEFRLIPLVSVRSNKTTLKNNIVQQGSSTISYSIGITMMWQQIYFEPRFVKNDGLTALALRVGYVM